jgi:hypothetical protein
MRGMNLNPTLLFTAAVLFALTVFLEHASAFGVH